MKLEPMTTEQRKSVITKITAVAILILMIAVSIPMIDWAICYDDHYWYLGGDAYFPSLDYTRSFMYRFYESRGENSSFMYECDFAFDKLWYEVCYRVYTIKGLYSDSSNVLPLFPFIIAAQLFLGMANVLRLRRHELAVKGSFIFHIVILAVTIVFCIYGIFFYAPQYFDYIYDIVTSA